MGLKNMWQFLAGKMTQELELDFPLCTQHLLAAGSVKQLCLFLSFSTWEVEEVTYIKSGQGSYLEAFQKNRKLSLSECEELRMELTRK